MGIYLLPFFNPKNVMNRAESYIASLRVFLNKLSGITNELTHRPDSKKLKASRNLARKQANDYKEKLDNLGMGDIIRTQFQVTTYGRNEDKTVNEKIIEKTSLYNSLHTGITKKEAKTLIEFGYSRDNTQIIIIHQEIAKTGYYEERKEEQKQEQPKRGRKKRASSESGESEEEA